MDENTLIQIEDSIFSAAGPDIIVYLILGWLLNLLILVVVFKYLTYPALRKVFSIGMVVFLLFWLPVFIRFNFPENLNFLEQNYLYKVALRYSEAVLFPTDIITNLLPLHILKLVLIACFLKYIVLRHKLGIKEQLMLFIPIIDLYYIAKYLFESTEPPQKPFSILLMLGALMLSFYTFLFPILLYLGVDTYSWYLDLLYGPPVVNVEDAIDGGITYLADLIIHAQATTTLIAAVLSFPAYFELNQFKIETDPA